MFTIKGKIDFDPINRTKKHDKQSSWKRTAMVMLDCDMSLYYRWILEKRFNLKLNPPLRGTHFTIINDRIDNDIYEQSIRLFDHKEIEFTYDPTDIKSNGSHWWIKAYSDDAMNIRRAIGLEPNPYFGFHITIGLTNPKWKDHSEYILRQCIKFNL